jgi:aryl-alcohol dehydrogenase-like predicted oxidoreductase
METTTEHDKLRYAKIPLTNGTAAIPALGFGTLIPDPIATKNATRAALEAGFRQLDSAERYRNEKEVGEAMQEVFKEGKIKREDVFMATKLARAGGSATYSIRRKVEWRTACRLPTQLKLHCRRRCESRVPCLERNRAAEARSSDVQVQAAA